MSIKKRESKAELFQTNYGMTREAWIEFVKNNPKEAHAIRMEIERKRYAV